MKLQADKLNAIAQTAVLAYQAKKAAEDPSVLHLPTTTDNGDFELTDKIELAARTVNTLFENPEATDAELHDVYVQNKAEVRGESTNKYVEYAELGIEAVSTATTFLTVLRTVISLFK